MTSSSEKSSPDRRQLRPTSDTSSFSGSPVRKRGRGRGQGRGRGRGRSRPAGTSRGGRGGRKVSAKEHHRGDVAAAALQERQRNLQVNTAENH